MTTLYIKQSLLFEFLKNAKNQEIHTWRADPLAMWNGGGGENPPATPISSFLYKIIKEMILQLFQKSHF